ncbi:hypothetical protein Mycsm_01787 [Mycobacterium sp. JS623]|nr:hypothetical protein Mycsm_01787 [Mycobacterium sp. JS623]
MVMTGTNLSDPKPALPSPADDFVPLESPDACDPEDPGDPVSLPHPAANVTTAMAAAIVHTANRAIKPP